MKLTDGERILEMFKRQPNIWVNHRYILDDMGISEYTGRLKDARDLINCTHGADKEQCQSIEHIVNVKKGWYMYTTTQNTSVTTQEIPQLNFDFPDYQQQRQQLLKEYQLETDPFKKELIKQKGLIIRQLINDQEYANMVREVLL